MAKISYQVESVGKLYFTKLIQSARLYSYFPSSLRPTPRLGYVTPPQSADVRQGRASRERLQEQPTPQVVGLVLHYAYRSVRMFTSSSIT